MRDSAPSYGGDEGAEHGYPGEEVLRDLETARDAGSVERVLARFTAFRSWLLRRADEPELADHALEAAAAHLAAAPEWPEGRLLRRLLSVPVDGEEAATLLAAAAMESAGSGEREGARALMTAARLAGPRRPPPT